MAHWLSCSGARGTLLDQGSNLCPLHWQADSQPRRHQGSPLHFSLNPSDYFTSHSPPRWDPICSSKLGSDTSSSLIPRQKWACFPRTPRTQFPPPHSAPLVPHPTRVLSALAGTRKCSRRPGVTDGGNSNCRMEVGSKTSRDGEQMRRNWEIKTEMGRVD